MNNVIQFKRPSTGLSSKTGGKTVEGEKHIALANMSLTPVEFSIKISRLSSRGAEKHIALVIVMIQEARDSWAYFSDKHFHFHLDTLLLYQEYIDE